MNRALMRLTRRAEMGAPASLVETFVTAGPLLDLLHSRDHQVLFGRRGTGKTHAFTYLAETAGSRPGNAAILVDMRSVGSTGGYYGDTSTSLAERGTRLLIDVLENVHDKLVDRALQGSFEGRVGDSALTYLDRLANELSVIRVVGSTETEQADSSGAERTSTSAFGVNVGSAPSIDLSLTDHDVSRAATELRVRRVGVAQHRVHVGAVRHWLEKALEDLGIARLWLLIDEWSSVPLELQPLLADMIRRAFLPIRAITVKLAAIEHRTDLKVPIADRDYLGLELGGDIAADLDLDDYMVFDNDNERAKSFFAALIFKHVVAVMKEEGNATEAPKSPADLIRRAFTQRNAFEELVRAAEGVPRDAINISIIGAQRADEGPISVPDIRTAAKSWYQRDKESAATANEQARQLLVYIIDEVIDRRRAKAFMLRHGADSQHPLIRSLYDNRILHLIKKGVSSRDEPGVRYNVFAIDYGCYVDLILTTRAPQLLPMSDSEEDYAVAHVDVPSEDYRSIRRAILDLSEFDKAIGRI